jgi:hypothetical protein
MDELNTCCWLLPYIGNTDVVCLGHKDPNPSLLWDIGGMPPCPSRDHDIQPFTSDLETFMCEKCGHKFKKHRLKSIDGRWRMLGNAVDRIQKKTVVKSRYPSLVSLSCRASYSFIRRNLP